MASFGEMVNACSNGRNETQLSEGPSSEAVLAVVDVEDESGSLIVPPVDTDGPDVDVVVVVVVIMAGSDNSSKHVAPLVNTTVN